MQDARLKRVFQQIYASFILISSFLHQPEYSDTLIWFKGTGLETLIVYVSSIMYNGWINLHRYLHLQVLLS